MPIIASFGSLNNKYYVSQRSPDPVRPPGYLYVEGDNTYGQCGLGTTGGNYGLTQVGTDTNWITGDYALSGFGIMIKSNGTMWGAGLNANYQLGLGDTVNRNTWTQIGVGTTWKKVSCGSNGALAIKSDGTMWGWGGFQYFGNTSPTSYTTPTQVNIATNWLDVKYYNYIATALKTDGTLWTAGDNRSGSCGRGLTVPGPIIYYAWGQVGSATDWSFIHTVKNGTANLAINNTGQLYGAGYLNILGGVTNNLSSITTPETVTGISGGIIGAPTFDSFIITTGSGNSYSLGYADIINPGYWVGIKSAWFNNGITMSEAIQGPPSSDTYYRKLNNDIYSAVSNAKVGSTQTWQNYGYTSTSVGSPLLNNYYIASP